jgi:hypothetical protein
MAILEGVRNGGDVDVCAVFQVGYGASDFYGFEVGSGGEIEGFAGGLEEAFCFIGDF